MAGFFDDYTDRTAGLDAFNNRATSVADKSPLGKFFDFTSEAFTPGYVQANERMAQNQNNTPFRDSTSGRVLEGMFPEIFHNVFEGQRSDALKNAFSGYQQAPNTGIDFGQPMQAPQLPSPAMFPTMPMAQPVVRSQPAQSDALQFLNRGTSAPSQMPKNAITAFNDSNTLDPMQGSVIPAQNYSPQDKTALSAFNNAPPIEFNAMKALLDNKPAAAVVAAEPKSSALQTFLGASESPHGNSTPIVQTEQQRMMDKYPAQTTKESSNDPNAVSPKGAFGLKQVMPATAVDPGYGVTPLQNNSPQENVRFGNDYMDAMVKEYKGNIPLALAAYNWGPNNVNKWLAAGADPAMMPKETVDYVNDLAPKLEAAQQQKSAPKTALSEYQDKALQLAQIDPQAYGAAALASFSPKADQATPYTDQGKLRSDLQNGLITQEQFNSALKNKSVSEDQIKLENQVRQEFEGLGTVKEFRTVDTAFTRMKNSVKEPSAAGDVAAVFNFMKMLDPGSTVREGEFATAQNSAGVPDVIRAQMNKLLSGERLAPAQREDFLKRAGMLHRGAQEGFNQTAERYQDISKQYGMNPERISRLVKIDPETETSLIDSAQAEMKRRGL